MRTPFQKYTVRGLTVVLNISIFAFPNQLDVTFGMGLSLIAYLCNGHVLTIFAIPPYEVLFECKLVILEFGLIKCRCLKSCHPFLSSLRKC